MHNHVGLGPVFRVEWMVNARKWHGYAARFFFGLALLFCITITSWSIGSLTSNHGIVTVGILSQFGEWLFEIMGTTQLLMVLLAAPAATAGAICQDRARGNLLHMMVTDLSDSEIVLGKLAARLVPILGLVFCSFPVMALSSLFGGIDPQAITMLLVISVALAVLGCTLALTLSLWMKKTHETLMGVLCVWAAWLLAFPMWEFFGMHINLGPTPKLLINSNPFFLMYAIYSVPRYPVTSHVGWFVAATLALSAILLIVAIRRLRTVIVRDGHGTSERKTRSSLWQVGRWLGPQLEPSPVLWRECHRNRPSRFARFLWCTYLILAASMTVLAVIILMHRGMAASAGLIIPELTFIDAFQISFGLLLVSAGAPTALAEERVRGSLDLLLSTPLSTRTILVGKWWGAFRVVPWLTILPVFAAFALALLVPTTGFQGTRGPGGTILPVDDLYLRDRVIYVILTAGQTLALGAAITSLGLALATWIPRVGRAVAFSIVAYVLCAFLWPVFLILLAEPLYMLIKDNQNLIMGLDPEVAIIGIAGLSPLASGIGRDICLLASLSGHNRMTIWVIELVWGLLMLAFAKIMFELTVRAFDRRLGRVSENGVKVPTTLGARSRPRLLRRRTHSVQSPV